MLGRADSAVEKCDAGPGGEGPLIDAGQIVQNPLIDGGI
jgi:hypothetical protein